MKTKETRPRQEKMRGGSPPRAPHHCSRPIEVYRYINSRVGDGSLWLKSIVSPTFQLGIYSVPTLMRCKYFYGMLSAGGTLIIL